MTKACIIAGLLLVATSAHAADHVWRMWCGNPPTKRAADDTSAQCDAAAPGLRNMLHACADSPEGPRYNGALDNFDREHGLRTCADVRRQFEDCHCEPEAVK
jgi:hypothetical protein